jgi:ribokinase
LQPRSRPQLTVVGSINLDLVAACEALPRPGETVSGARFERHPGGKGANQAVAAARLGAQVRVLGAVGRDPNAADALAGCGRRASSSTSRRSTRRPASR